MGLNLPRAQSLRTKSGPLLYPDGELLGRSLFLWGLWGCGPGPQRLTLHPFLDLHIDSHSLSELEVLLHPTPVPAFIFFGDRVQGQGEELVVLVAVHGGLARALILAGQGLATFAVPLAPEFLIGDEFAW